MAGSLIVGTLLALGHHLFYASLAFTEAPTGISLSLAGVDVSRQQLNTAVGTPLAFLTKTFLEIAMSIAFVQVFWRAVLTSSKGSKLATLHGA